MAASGPGTPLRLDPTTSDSLATIARAVSAGSEVLELGPGPGTLTQHLREALGCQVDCVERSPEMAASARSWARNVWEADLDTTELGERSGGRTYDLVIAADVLEHLEDPARVLEQCRERLKPGGELLLSLPNVGHAAVLLELMKGRFPYGGFGILDRTHRWFFTRESVLALVRGAGFRVESIDTIVRMPETTEFQRRFDQLSASLRTELLHHPDALTYQFVTRARVGSMPDEEWDALRPAQIAPELRYRAKLYWATPGGPTSEDRHLSAFGTLGHGRQRLSFALPDEEPIGVLRLDPAEGPGFAHLYSIEIRTGEETVLRLDGPQAIAEAATMDGILALGGPDGGFLMRTEDPFLQLPLERPLPAGPGRQVLVEMDWPASRDYALAREQIDTLQAENQEQRTQHAAETDALRNQNASLADQNAALANENTALADHVAGLETQVEATAAHARSLEEMLRQVFESKGWRALEWLRALKPRRG